MARASKKNLLFSAPHTLKLQGLPVDPKIAKKATMKPSFLLRIPCFVLLIAIAAGSLISPAHAAVRTIASPHSETPDITPVIEKYRTYIQTAMRQQHIPGLAIVVVDDQNVLWQEGFGHTSTDRRIPVTPDTPFSIQSMSKSFTALTVLMAVQDGLLDLDTPLSTYLPDFRVNSIFEPVAADKINLRNLLSCTAGFTHEAPVGNNYVLAPSTFETHAASIQDTWLKFPVGQMYSYSNLGIDLAGYIVQAQAGMPFAQYAQEKLFAPLGMTRSTFDIDTIAQMPDRAIGHDILLPKPPLVAMMPCGGVYTTAADMARYLQFHINGGLVNDQRLISQELLQTMYTPQFPASINENYGLGIAVLRNHNARMLAHGGGGFGFISNMVWYPELKLGIATLTNSVTHSLQGALEAKIIDDIIALDPVLYTQRAIIQPPAAVRNNQEAGLLSAYHLRTRIQSLAPEPTTVELAEWRKYTGIYGFRYFNNITQLMYVDMVDDSLTLDGEKIYGFGSGLFILPDGEALNLASEPRTYRNIPLKKLNLAYFWFLRGISLASLLFFLGAVLALPLLGAVALFRRKQGADQPQGGFPGWLTGLLVWLAALLGLILLLGTAVLPFVIRGSAPTPLGIWSQYPALIYGRLPTYNPTLPVYVHVWMSLPLAIIFLTIAAGIGTWQAWRSRRWSRVGRVLLTAVIALLLITVALIW